MFDIFLKVDCMGLIEIYKMAMKTLTIFPRTNFCAGCVQLWICSAEPPWEHRNENWNNDTNNLPNLSADNEMKIAHWLLHFFANARTRK